MFQVFSKIEIAQRQIHTAIDVFLAGGDFLAIITLAGAGEEILGKLLERQGQRNMVDALKDLDVQLSGGRAWKIVNSEINGVRNALKHANDPSETTIEVDPDHQVAMLARPVNYYLHL